jgi:quinoprotein glucose dehydrogenase
MDSFIARSVCVVIAALAVTLLPACQSVVSTDAEWSSYGGHVDGDRYSALAQITPANVAQLKEAWRVVWTEPGDPETNPLIVGRTLYGYKPGLSVVALDAANGRQIWRFDPGVQGPELAPACALRDLRAVSSIGIPATSGESSPVS